MYITIYNWKQSYKKLFESCQNFLGIQFGQFYYPIMSLFLKIHNTKHSHQCIDMKRKYILQKIDSINTSFQDDYHSNNIGNATLFDIHSKKTIQKEIFIKQLSILDPNHILMNHYNLLYPRNSHLPSTYNYITNQKIHDINNSCYIDCFFSFIVGNLKDQNKNPSFPEYYGSINGISKHKLDITEDIQEIESYECFQKGLHTIYDINVYTDDETKINDKQTSISNSTDNSDDSDDSEDDYIVEFKKIPVLCIFMEKLDGTLEDLLTPDSFDVDLYISMLFQITFALAYLQKHFQFIHNDLHINNIMYIKTDLEYLYYQLEGEYYRVPTFGYIFKIIDYGRSIFTYHKHEFINDSFLQHGEADTQYKIKDKHILNKNFSFDLCRLSTTILDELNDFDESFDSNPMYIQFVELLLHILKDEQDEYIYDGTDNSFQLYVDITDKAVNGIPKDVLKNEIFHKLISEKINTHYYSLN